MKSLTATLSRHALWIGGLGSALLVAASWPMQSQTLPLWARAALVCGLALWLAVAVLSPEEPERMETAERGQSPPRRAALVVAAILLPFAWWGTRGGVFHTFGVIAWIGASALWLHAWWPRQAGGRLDPATASRWAARGALGAVLILAVFFSFYHLRQTPRDPISDHAETQQDVSDLLNGYRPIFFPRNTGREPFKFYLLFFLVKFVGLPLDYLTLKVATALVGLLAIPAVYLLGKELGGARLGLLAAAFTAWSRWHFGMARIGLRVTHAVAPTAFVLWALARYMRRGDRASALWAGIGIGLGLYGYTPFRIVPLLVPLAFGFLLWDPRWRGRRRVLVHDGLLLVLTAALLFLPMLHYMVEHPENFWRRVLSRAASGERPIGPNPLGVFARNVGSMALAFDWKGVTGWVNAIEWAPLLDFVEAGLFLAGLLLALGQVVRGSRRWVFLLLSLFVLTLPTTLNIAFPDENPSINRIVTAIPVTMVLVALPLARLATLAASRGAAARAGTAAGIAILAALSIEQNFKLYFVDFDRAYPSHVQPAVEMAETIKSYEARGVPLSNVYILAAGYWVDERSVSYELGDPNWFQTNTVAPDVPPSVPRKHPMLFVFKPSDNPERLRVLRSFGGEERLVPQTPPQRTFGVYYVP